MAYGTKVNMENCWFAGSVTNKASASGKRGTGGLIGVVYDSGSAKLTGCLNTGTIDVTAYTYDQNQDPNNPNVSPIAGGLVGYVKSTNSCLDITDCLSTKAVLTVENAKSNGSILGLTENKARTTVSNVYSTVEKAIGSSVVGKVFVKTEEDIKGYEGYKWTLLNFDEYWAVVLDNTTTPEDESGTPILKSFASIVPSLKNVDKMLDIDWLGKGDGSEEKPYILSDKGDLYGLAMLAGEPEYEGFAGKIFKLAADIEINTGYATNWASEPPEYSWTPIGSNDLPFAGIFDGADPETGKIHTISGIYINTSGQRAGLFGVIQTAADCDTASIQNLKLKNSYIFSSTNLLGSVAGYVNGGKIDTVYSDTIVKSSGSGYQGGFVGVGKNTEMNNCMFDGIVINTNKNGQRIGGFIGQFASGALNMTDCLNMGTLDCAVTQDHPFVAGLVGSIENNATIKDCMNAGDISTNSKYDAAAFTGNINSGKQLDIYTSYTEVERCAVGYKPGIVKVYNENNEVVSTVSGHYTEVTQTFMNSGLTNSGTLKGFDFGTVWTAVLNGAPVLTTFKNETILPDTSWHVSGCGTEDKPYLISDRNDLYGLAILSQEDNFAGEYFALTQDIVVNDGDANDWDGYAPKFEWTPIGPSSKPFAGIFNGADPETGKIHSISGIYLNTTAQTVGLFAYTADGSIIRNLKLTNSYFNSSAGRVGSIAGQLRGTLHTVYSDAIVTSSANYAGGLASIVANSTSYDVDIINCWFAGTVKNTSTDKQYTAGLVAFAYAKSLDIINCLNTGTVDVSAYTSTDYPFASGLLGYARCSTNIEYSLNAGTITLNPDKTSVTYGAIVGYIHASTQVDIDKTYTDSNKCVAVCGYNNNGTVTVNGTTIGRYAASKNLSVEGVSISENVTGEAAKTGFTELDFSDEGNWVVNPNGTPILKSFK
jgi:hypothetical protein